ncbi:hypothetical protein BABA_05531 [Neobacillus bataviensis LMG 21833]|uniref:DUF2178 domain-containing protein n=1 Tax=Neobacillus bataviensis LMG 21833 TaxID=1117379 RepID=K6DPT5_9BACI|nr:hypothetical protein [Neobacillus bataviensis]EKN70344.1 hypothetical protein BABA_05531 [Neobacillus bataviensis LMG 21833]
MNNRKLQITIWSVVIGCMSIGGFLGMYLVGKETGEYNYEMAIAIIGGTVLGFIFFLLISMWNKKRNGNVPDVDERSILLMNRYLMGVLYVVLMGSGAVLLILYSMGVHFIETGMLIICMIGLYMLIGLGAVITKQL